jgi:hypothetical protein
MLQMELDYALQLPRDGHVTAGSDPHHATKCGRGNGVSPAEIEEVAAELGRTLDHVKVPKREKDEVLAAFAAHKGEPRSPPATSRPLRAAEFFCG